MLWKSALEVCFGSDTIVDVFRQVGTIHYDRERLKIFVNASPNSGTQSLRTCPGTPSGPATLLILRSERITSAGDSSPAFSVWSWTGGCHSLHLEAGEEPVELLMPLLLFWLVIWHIPCHTWQGSELLKKTLLCGGNTVHVTFYVKQYRGSLGVYVIILKYRPVSVAETILQLLEASSGHACMNLAVGYLC